MSHPPPLINSAETSNGASRVPARFGTGGMLFLLTIFCALFGLLKWVNAPGAIYLVVILFLLIVGIAQMRWGETPREVSIAMGAIILPVAVVSLNLLEGYVQDSEKLTYGIIFIPVGALFGYLAGAVLASFFLVSRLIDQSNDRDPRKPIDTFTSAPPPPARWTEQPSDMEIVDEPARTPPKRMPDIRR